MNSVPIRLDTGVQRQVDWLLDGPIRLGDGTLAAWAEGSEPSHVYEESTGYLITLLCFLYRLTADERYEVEAGRTVRALAATLGSREGCGRDGVLYLFDTSVCLRALAAFFAIFPAAEESREPGLARTLAGVLARTAQSLAERRAACVPERGGANEDAGRWSTVFGPHLIKSISNMSPGGGPWRSIADELISRWYPGGQFRPDSGGSPAYLHAHCYAVEGMLALQDVPRQVVERVTVLLAEEQAESGGIPRWWPGDQDPVLAADATAQAVRLWLLLDRERFQDNIRRGTAYMGQILGPGGGVLYSPRRNHENSWATIFAVQALIWQDVQPDPAWLI